MKIGRAGVSGLLCKAKAFAIHAGMICGGNASNVDPNASYNEQLS
jgi:hypothetical protein